MLTARETRRVRDLRAFLRVGPARGTAWLDALKELPRGWPQAARVIIGALTPNIS